MRDLHESSRRRGAITLVVCLATAFNCGCDEDPQIRTVSDNKGWDIHPFANATAMYTTPPLVTMDARGREQLLKIDELLLANPNLPDTTTADAWWMGLAYLNKHRDNSDVQRALAGWATRCAENVKGSSGGADVQLFSEANSLYRQGNFGAASQRYVQLLAKCPGHLDARNNLGLAQLHKGNDLIAQLEWEILRRVSDRYLPARVNLTVVHERLGQREHAHTMAEEAMSLQGESPIAVFNLAWLEDVEGEHQSAEELLRPFAELEVNGRLTALHSLVRRQAAE